MTHTGLPCGREEALPAAQMRLRLQCPACFELLSYASHRGHTIPQRLGDALRALTLLVQFDDAPAHHYGNSFHANTSLAEYTNIFVFVALDQKWNRSNQATF